MLEPEPVAGPVLVLVVVPAGGLDEGLAGAEGEGLKGQGRRREGEWITSLDWLLLNL